MSQNKIRLCSCSNIHTTCDCWPTATTRPEMIAVLDKKLTGMYMSAYGLTIQEKIQAVTGDEEWLHFQLENDNWVHVRDLEPSYFVYSKDRNYNAHTSVARLDFWARPNDYNHMIEYVDPRFSPETSNHNPDYVRVEC